MASPLSPHNATTQLTTFKSYVALIADATPGSKFTTLVHGLYFINPFTSSGPVHPYQMDESVRGVWLTFYFYPFLNRNSCKQTVSTLIRCRILRHLIWVYTVCLGPVYGTVLLGFYFINQCGVLISYLFGKRQKQNNFDETF